MKGLAVDHLVFEQMFPKPKATDPQNFQGLLQRQLVPEVRLETQAFYGHLSSQEAKYPGLDYSYKPHRVRLSRYPWHRRLFRAFDNLGLTNSEIASLTKWEGTRWAKERFEREQGIVIKDTTADGIMDWVPPELRRTISQQAHHADIEVMDDVQEGEETEDNEAENEEMDEDAEDSDAELQSVGTELNERLRAAAAQREAGQDTVMDEEWEQWLKETVEAGGLPFLSADLSPHANIPGTRPAFDSPHLPASILNAARLGQWDHIPDYLHNYIRREMEANRRRMEDAPITSSTPSSSASSTNGSGPFASTRTLPIPTPTTAAAAAPSSRVVSPFASRTLQGRQDLSGHFVRSGTGSPRARPAIPAPPALALARLQGRSSEQISRRTMMSVDRRTPAMSVHNAARGNQPGTHP
ncbi:hypothetical protein LZ554_008204 [Drepanopeziza brunnea f. sp. 'monogermtubi']|nr:hypothetical protein LZ554_008204 [Drepanopeziza brunnea f. sp. 'monogermtubi']